MSTSNITEGSSVAPGAVPDEAAYATSDRTKKLFAAIDQTLGIVETELKYKFTRALVKPLRRRVKKSASEPVAQAAEKMIEDWRSTAQDAMNEIISEGEVTRLLYTLDELVKREKKRNPDKIPAWRPSEYPFTDLQPYFTQRKLEYRDRLKEMAENMEREATENKNEVERGREEIFANDKKMGELAKEIRRELKSIKGKSDENGESKLTKDQIGDLKKEIEQFLN